MFRRREKAHTANYRHLVPGWSPGKSVIKRLSLYEFAPKDWDFVPFDRIREGFAIELVNFELNLPDGQVKFFGGIQIKEELWNQFCSSKRFGG